MRCFEEITPPRLLDPTQWVDSRKQTNIDKLGNKLGDKLGDKLEAESREPYCGGCVRVANGASAIVSSIFALDIFLVNVLDKR